MNLFELPHLQKVQSKNLWKIILLIPFLLLLVPAVSAQDFQIAARAELEFSESSSITIVPESPSYTINSVSTYLYLYPRSDWRQTVLGLETEPASREEDGRLVFEWEEPGLSLSFSLQSSVSTRNDIQKITKRAAFPVDVPPELANFTLPTPTIDYNDPAITSLANSMAEGETDLYVLMHRFGAWVDQNIEYDLSCEPTVEKASWVLKNKKGVCDEFSTLFIALARAVGVPTRYVAGMAYSNIPGKEGFGPHGWVEVYFPGTGWVPFDPTFGQLGWIDTSHIKLSVQQDTNESSVRYKWVGTGISAETYPLEMDTKLTTTSGTAPAHLSLAVSPFHSEAGFGSYNIIQVALENLNNYYVPTELVFGRTEHLEMTGSPYEHVLLKPGKTRTVYRIVRINPDLRPGYIYTFPIGVETARNLSAFSEIRAGKTYRAYTLAEMEHYLSLMEEEETKEYSKELDLSCSPESEEVYTEEQTTITCTLHNKGNTALAGLEVCLDSDCETLDLPIGQRREMAFTLTAPESEGTLDLLASARNKDVSKTHKVMLSVIKSPGFLDQLMEAINSFFAWLAGLFS